MKQSESQTQLFADCNHAATVWGKAKVLVPEFHNRQPTSSAELLAESPRASRRTQENQQVDDNGNTSSQTALFSGDEQWPR